MKDKAGYLLIVLSSVCVLGVVCGLASSLATFAQRVEADAQLVEADMRPKVVAPMNISADDLKLSRPTPPHRQARDLQIGEIGYVCCAGFGPDKRVRVYAEADMDSVPNSVNDTAIKRVSNGLLLGKGARIYSIHVNLDPAYDLPVVGEFDPTDGGAK